MRISFITVSFALLATFLSLPAKAEKQKLICEDVPKSLCDAVRATLVEEGVHALRGHTFVFALVFDRKSGQAEFTLEERLGNARVSSYWELVSAEDFRRFLRKVANLGRQHASKARSAVERRAIENRDVPPPNPQGRRTRILRADVLADDIW